MSTHHAQITAAATKHGWVIRESSPNWMELIRGHIELSFSFRIDGRLSTGTREDNDARPGYAITSILGRAKNKLADALAWITEPAPQEAATVELDANSVDRHGEPQEPTAVDQADTDTDPPESTLPQSDFDYAVASMIAGQIRLALSNTAALTAQDPERPKDTVEHLTQAYQALKHQYGLR